MDFNYVKYNPSNFKLPPRDTCLLSNVYDIPCINPEYEDVKQCKQILENFTDNNNNIVLKNKKYLWTFVETDNINYINLNIKSFIKYYQKYYNIVILNKDNISKYLPKFPFNMNNIDNINMNKKIDYLKYSLLYNYGGLWIDSSVLIFTHFNLKKFLQKYDIVLFNNPNLNSCLTTNTNNSIFEFPNTKILLAKPKLNIIKYLLKRTCETINNFNSNYEFNNISEKILYDGIKLFLNKNDCNKRCSNVNILLLPSNYIGKLTKQNNVLLIDDYIKQYKYELKPKAFCTIIDNNENFYKSPYELFHNNIWFLKLNNQLLVSSMFVSYIYRLN